MGEKRTPALAEAETLAPHPGPSPDGPSELGAASTVDGVERSVTTEDDPEGSPLLTGQRLGSYVVGPMVGSGAMGTVYRATHHSLGHAVAIKIIQAGIVGGDSAAAHERFFREARAAARLEHEGIVRVVDFARDPAVGSYIVMELVRGEGLDVWLRRDPKPTAGEIARLGASIADTIQAAHDGGVVHRDLKPANVLVVVKADRLTTKVADFGVAKLFDAPEHLATKTGKLVGTPLYMSPEQWRGEKVDPRSDIYALGVLLYELASGSLPHTGSAYEIAYKVATELPAPLVTLRPDLPRDLLAVVDRCLAKQLDDRYPTMRAVAIALEEIAEREAPARASLRSLPPPPAFEQAAHLHLPRSRLPLFVLLALFALLGVAVVVRPPSSGAATAPSSSAEAAIAAPVASGQAPSLVASTSAPSVVLAPASEGAKAAPAPAMGTRDGVRPSVDPKRGARPASGGSGAAARPPEPDEELFRK